MIYRGSIVRGSLSPGLPPGGLGFLPLALLAIGTGLGMGYLWDRREAEYEAWKKQLQSPAAPPAPPAPQTPEQMRSWTPEQLRQAWERARITEGQKAIPLTPDQAPAASPADNSLLWAALGLGAVSLFLMVRS